MKDSPLCVTPSIMEMVMAISEPRRFLVYKVVIFENGVLRSLFAPPALCLRYKPGQWTRSPLEGSMLFAFEHTEEGLAQAQWFASTLDTAWSRHVQTVNEVWEAEALPPVLPRPRCVSSWMLSAKTIQDFWKRPDQYDALSITDMQMMAGVNQAPAHTVVTPALRLTCRIIGFSRELPSATLARIRP